MTGSAITARIPSLDGLRAISIAIVLFAHSLKHSVVESSWLHYLEKDYFRGGTMGVSIFFVISGFLITLLLVREEKAAGRIDLGDFYLRRVFRLFPAYYTYLLFVTVLVFLGVVEIGGETLLSAALFYLNYTHVPGAYLVQHSWSLSLEEQFYLFWPLLLVISGRKRATAIAVGLIALGPFIRVLSYFLLPKHRDLMNLMLHTRIDTLMYGCLAGLLFDSAAFRGYCERIFRRGGHIVALLFFFGLSPYLCSTYGGKYVATLHHSLEGAAITVLMMWVVLNPGTAVGRALNWRPVAHIGVISYSLYLWQQPFMPFTNSTIWGGLPFNLVPIFVLAYASHYGVERRFIQLGARVRARFKAAAAAHKPGTAI